MTASVLLHCDAGPKAGYGHLSRCATLAQGLRATGIATRMVVSGGGQAALNFVARQVDQAESAHTAIGTMEDADTMLAQYHSAHCGAIILDSRELNTAYLQRLRSAAYVVILDDDCRCDLPCDILINPHFWVAPEHYGECVASHILAGAAYNLINPAYFSQREDRDPTKPLQRMLITMGGEDPWNCTSWLLRHAGDFLTDYAVDVVVGAAHPALAEVEATARQLTDCRVAYAPAGLMPFVAAADVALSAGGTTCYELAAAGVPMAVVALEAHQQDLIDRLTGHRAAVQLASYADKDVSAMRHALEGLLENPALRAALSRSGRQLFAAPGANHVAASIKELAKIQAS